MNYQKLRAPACECQGLDMGGEAREIDELSDDIKGHHFFST